MDFETMRAANPELIYCSISGFGDEGPWRDLTAHGQTIDSYAGLVDVVDGYPQPHTRPGWRTAGTTLGGVFAAIGLLAAINRRDRARLADDPIRPQYLSVSLWQAAMWWSWRDTTMFANADKPWLDYTDLGSRYGLYETADGRVVLLAPIEQKFWRTFCDLAGLPEETRERGDWTAGMFYGEGPDFIDERREIATRVGERTLDEWIELLAPTDVPFAPLLTIDEALSSEHAEANGILRDVDVDGRALRIPASPVRFGRSDDHVDPPAAMPGPPKIGEHSAEIRRLLGLADDNPTLPGGATA
jgi:crotonobetainyl-CoA:carnitine CoA-transferase CaiB-like acyl-CoA transferase